MSEEFEDTDSYSYNFKKDKLTFNDIILLHLKKIGEFASCEWRGGFWQEKPVGSQGDSIRIYISDTRETYSNAVEYLHDLLYPYFDEDIKKASEEAEKEIKQAFNDFTVEKAATRNDENAEEGKKYRVFSKDLNKVFFRDKRVKICRKLFRELCCFLYRKKYLELGTIQD